MDQNVLDSLKKWPNVPFCYGWLAFDRRGDWRMRNEFAQQNKLPGDVIRHTALKEFIERNYARDLKGQFFFQNGPQRVFVSLGYTPWVVRLIPHQNGWKFQTTSGIEITPNHCLLDEDGQILIEATYPIIQEQHNSETPFKETKSVSIGLLHDHDLDIFSSLANITQNACSLNGQLNWQGQKIEIEQVLSADLPSRYGFHTKPQA
jgi:hypothetical protein